MHARLAQISKAIRADVIAKLRADESGAAKHVAAIPDEDELFAWFAGYDPTAASGKYTYLKWLCQ